MKRKLFSIIALVALLVTAFVPVSAAYADGARIKGFASISKVTVVDPAVASFKLLGSYTCDKMLSSAKVEGKTVSIFIYDIKKVGSGNQCNTSKGFKTFVTLGRLVPGTYTVLINPDGTGKFQKKLKFVMPMPAATATPAP